MIESYHVAIVLVLLNQLDKNCVLPTAVINCEILYNLFPSLAHDSDQFSLMYYELHPNPNCHSKNSFIHPRSIILSNTFQQMVLREGSPIPYKAQLLLPHVSSLSQEEINVAFTSCPGPAQFSSEDTSHLMLLFYIFRIFMFSHTTLFIIFGGRSQPDCNWILELWVYYQPALKLFIVEETPPEMYSMFLLRLNSIKYPTFQYLPSQRLDRPVSFHRKHFSVFQRRYATTPASVMDRYLYRKYYQSNQNACLGLVYQLSKYCTYEIMTALHLSQIHNMSFDLQDLFIPHDGDSYEFIAGLIGSSYMPLRFTGRNIGFLKYLRKIQFGFVGTKTMVYCDIARRKKKMKDILGKVDFDVWIYSFDQIIWILIFSACLTISAVLVGINFESTSFLNVLPRFMGALAGIIGIIIGDGSVPATKKWFYALTVFFGVVICELYSNAITSLVTAPTPPIVYESLSELIQANFKILEKTYEKFRAMFNDSFWHIGYSEADMNNTLQLYDGKPHEWLVKRDTHRYTIEWDMSVVQHTKSIYAKEIERTIFRGRRDGSVKCQNTRKHHIEMILFWSIDTANRHWMMRTIQWMHNAGLRELWMKWMLWGILNEQRLLSKLYSKFVTSADIITLEKIYACIVLVVGAFATAGMTFLIEFTLGRKRTTIVTQFVAKK